jgi:hypothetical protein
MWHHSLAQALHWPRLDQLVLNNLALLGIQLIQGFIHVLQEDVGCPRGEQLVECICQLKPLKSTVLLMTMRPPLNGSGPQVLLHTQHKCGL